MGEKLFSDVFPGVRTDEALADWLNDVTVTKIAVNRSHTALRVYIQSSRLIEKELIYNLEKNLASYLRTGKKIKIRLIEKYNLSSLYTPENLFEIYRDGFFLEIREKSLIAANMFKTAKARFEDGNTLYLTIETHIARDETTVIIRQTVEDIYSQRFGMPVKVRVLNYDAPALRYEEENRERLRLEAQNLIMQSESGDRKELYGNDIGSIKSGGIGSGSNIPSAKDSVKKDKKSGVPSAKGKTSRGFRGRKKGYFDSGNPDVLYGREFDFSKEISISDIHPDIGTVVINGQIFKIDSHSIKDNRAIITVTVTDFTDSINLKIFLPEDAAEEFTARVKKEMFVRVKGTAVMDSYEKGLTIQSVTGIMRSKDLRLSRQDNAPKKRIELHCHTKMSDMDGVSDVRQIVGRAYDWGHKAVAITDHGVVLAFPNAWHEYCDIKKECEKDGKPFDFKVIYGVEAYLVDDLKDIITNSAGQDLSSECVVFDLETTGLNPRDDRIIEIGAVKVKNEKVTDRFSTFVNPGVPIPPHIERLTGIRDDMVENAPPLEAALPGFLEFCGDAVMVAHNAGFDMSFISDKSRKLGIEREFTVVDTLTMAQYLISDIGKYTLDHVAKALNIPLGNHHRAVDDAWCTAKIYIELVKMLKDKGLYNLDDVNEAGRFSENRIKKAHASHAIILVKNDLGRVNLYRLISLSHLKHFYKRPRILKSEYQKYSEGLMIGSACESGELYQAILHGYGEREISRIAGFYDYYEVQPLGNNRFLVEDKDSGNDGNKTAILKSDQDLIDINKKIIALGRKFNKLTVATCDVHFLDPDDKIYREIIQTGSGYKDAGKQPPLYLRTTEEMLDEFDYLDRGTAEEIVIENPDKINSMIENISPVHPDKCPPVIENSDEQLKEICYKRAHQMYGDPLPEYVADRLEKELGSIIRNGYAVMYIMAQRVVRHSNEEGYLVGSRGSVGSSFVATMAGITEVNPLKPHYYCPKCCYSEFDSDDIKKSGADVGFDLPDKNCPVCGEKLKKDGIDIPFETFLGFYGDKEPDIDLNFSGDNQSEAHAYTEKIFGKGNTFRAGTITGIAEKTAYGYVRNYFEKRGESKRECEIERIRAECMGIRKSTGQHPGGIVILPADKEIYEFTPVQYPANDVTAETVTTHFEYHAIDSNLLKLDLLGHDDPTMIRKLELLTGTDAKNIPFDDEKVLSLFSSSKALGLGPDETGADSIGTLGLPELGTDFSMRLIEETKPKTVADLLRISGLSHGENVWSKNAQDLIRSGQATLKTVISIRDDIMTFLIGKGIEPGTAFSIMEAVRKKGKCPTPEDESVMREHEVPEWYIESCKKITYMFPKAHAAAYIMMALRVAWYKVYYPLPYYAAYFSIRAKTFNYGMMCRGPEKLRFYIDDYQGKKDRGELPKKDEDTLRDMNIVKEMLDRGFSFMPIDLYRAKAHEFQIIDGKLMPALDSIEGLGEAAADGVEEAARNGKFLSKDDLRDRARITKTAVENMSELGLLDGLPEGNQLSLFDFV